MRGFCIRLYACRGAEQQSVGDAPVNHLICRFSAAGADIAQMLLCKRNAAGTHPGFFFHAQFACQIAAPHRLNESALALLQFLGFLYRVSSIGVGIQILFGFFVKSFLHIVQNLGEALLQFFQRHGNLFAVIPSDANAASVFQILGAQLYTKRNALHLILGTLPAQRVVAVINLCPETGSLDSAVKRLRCFQNAFLMLGYGNDNHLNRGNFRRKHQSGIVAVGHDDSADNSRGKAPACLEGILLRVVLVSKCDIKLAGKAVSEEMAGTGLERLFIMHHAFDGIGVYRAGELLFICLVAADDRHCQIILAEICIDFQLCQRLLSGFFFRCMKRMTLLPQEFSASQERSRGLFPTHNAAPLVVFHRQISPGMQNMTPVITEQRFTGRTDAESLREFFLASYRDPRTLGCKAFNVILFLLKKGLRNQHRHGDILMSVSLEHAVQNALNVFPDSIAIGAQHKQALDAGIVYQLSLRAHIREPLGEIHFHIGDLLYFFIVCHNQKILSAGAPAPAHLAFALYSPGVSFVNYLAVFYSILYNISDITSEVNAINKQKFLAELERLLSFMYEEDKASALAMYEKMFDDVPDVNALLRSLVSPTRQAVVLARSYQAEERRAALEAGASESAELPQFVTVIQEVFDEAMDSQPEEAKMDTPVLDDQISLFGSDEVDAFLISVLPPSVEAPSEPDVSLPEIVLPADSSPAADFTEKLPSDPADHSSDFDFSSDFDVEAFLKDFELKDAAFAAPAAAPVVIPAITPEITIEPSPDIAPPAKPEPVIPELNSKPAVPVTEPEPVIPAAEPEPVILRENPEPEQPVSPPVQYAMDGYSSYETAARPLNGDEIPDELFETGEKKPPVKLKGGALALFLLIAIPLTALAVIVILALAAVALAVSAGFFFIGGSSVIAAFGGFQVFADVLIMIGIGVILIAVGLLFLWLFIWLLGGLTRILVGGIIDLAVKLCSKKGAEE